MLPFIIYLVAGLVTALHLYALLSLAVLGAPQSGLEFLGLFGSACLCIAACIALVKPRSGSMLALPSTFFSWAFYGPAIVATLTNADRQVTANLKITLVPYAAVGSLAFATVYAALASFRKEDYGPPAGSWLFPRAPSSANKAAVAISFLAFAVAISAWFGFSHKTVMRRSSRFLIPDGYVGWVRVEFQVPGAAPLPVEGRYYKLEIPPTGVLRTSSPEQFGLSEDQYFYTSSDHLEPLPSAGNSGRRIWGRMNGETGAVNATKFEEFFVGSEEQFKRQAAAPITAPAASGQVAK